eukprot:scaffold82852_cov63-Phaeocystis_antarctica.AAC.1
MVVTHAWSCAAEEQRKTVELARQRKTVEVARQRKTVEVARRAYPHAVGASTSTPSNAAALSVVRKSIQASPCSRPTRRQAMTAITHCQPSAPSATGGAR